MSLATLIPIVLRASIAIMVFALGLHVSLHDTTYLLHRPRLLLRSVLAMNVVMPLVASLLFTSIDMHPAVGVGLLVLSISPVPPLLPMKELKAGGGSEFTFSLLVTEALLAILFVPMSVQLLDQVLGARAHVSPAAVALVVSTTVLAPLGAGMLVRWASFDLAERIVTPVSRVAAGLLAASLIPILLLAMPAFGSLIGNGTLAVIVAFILVGLAAGHLLGGPEPKHRTVLALSTASRHPAVALSISSAGVAEQRLVLAAVLLYLMVNAVVSIPYLIWRRLHSGSQMKQPHCQK